MNILTKKLILPFIIYSIFSLLNSQCDEGYTYFNEIPNSTVITQGDSCFYDNDVAVLDSIIIINGLNYESPLSLGPQLWSNGRLRSLTGTYNPGGGPGINQQIVTLPENIGDLNELGLLYLEKHQLTTLPNSFTELESLFNLAISQNYIHSLPENFGNLNNLYFLDLGYNLITELPQSICSLDQLQYLWLFNNDLISIPACICELNLNFSGDDPGFYPYFGIGANEICFNIPDCLENINSLECGSNLNHFHMSLDQNYYSFQLCEPQGCDIDGNDSWEIIDLIMTIEAILSHNNFDNEQFNLADINSDQNLDIIDIILIIETILYPCN